MMTLPLPSRLCALLFGGLLLGALPVRADVPSEQTLIEQRAKIAELRRAIDVGKPSSESLGFAPGFASTQRPQDCSAYKNLAEALEQYVDSLEKRLKSSSEAR